ncbi:MAG TPA: hypothetical protein VK973_05865 [Arenicellales bacterium]|nr:hypothetical protein [Arenicellales bacterium]
MTDTTIYAAYDAFSIYGLGATPEAAIQRARDKAKDDTATFETAEIERRFAEYIEEHGFDGKHDSFEIVDGVIQAPSE